MAGYFSLRRNRNIAHYQFRIAYDRQRHPWAEPIFRRILNLSFTELGRGGNRR
jgi:hypothetical protein